MSDLQRIIESLPHLDHNELMQIHVRVGSLLKNSLDSGSSHKSSKYTEPDVDSLMLIEVISDVLASRSGFCIPVPVLRKMRAFLQMQGKTKRLFQFINQSNLSHSEMRLLLKIGVRLIISELHEKNLSAGGMDLMMHIHRMPSVLNRAFPGYAASGALYMLVRRNRENSNGKAPPAS